MAEFLANTWPILGALALIGILTYGALQPYIRAEKRRQKELEKIDD